MRKFAYTAYITIIITLIIVGSFISVTIIKNTYIREIERNLTNSAFNLSNNIETILRNSNRMDYDSIAVYYAENLTTIYANNKDNLKYRVTFIDKTGNVIGESDYDRSIMNNHLDRPEIQESLIKGTGINTRRSATKGINYLYAAFYNDTINIFTRVSVPLKNLNTIISKIYFITAIGTILSIIILIIVTEKISRKIINPITKLTKATMKITDGDFSERINIRDKYEIGQLADNFNIMADKLNNSLIEIKRKNNEMHTIINSINSGLIAVDSDCNVILLNPVAINMLTNKNRNHTYVGENLIHLTRNNEIRDVIEKSIVNNKTYEKCILKFEGERKYYMLFVSPINSYNNTSENSGAIAIIQDITNTKKLEEIRSEFVSNVTHELKTPLTSIRGFVETLKNGGINDNEVAMSFLDIIDIESERLYNLINDILQLSEIERMEKSMSSFHRIELKPIVNEVVDIMKDIAKKRNISLHVKIDENLYLSANRDRIKQMFINLIDNAIKYNTESGIVKINCKRGKGTVYINIKDDGIGMNQENLSRIFERFYRVDKSRSKSMGGTGLGLSIVKHIVNLYGGNINVQSTINIGTEFIIQFPLI